MTAAAPEKAKDKKAAKKPAAPKKPKGLDSSEKAEVFDKAAAIEDQIKLQEGTAEDLRQKLKAAKEELAGSKAKQRRLIWEAAHPEAHPLYNTGTKAAPAPSANGQAPAPIGEDESWKAVTLAEAFPGLPKKILEHLDAAHLRTMGELAAWINANQGRNKLTDIPGIGPDAEKKIQEADEAFWKRRKEALATVQQVATATNVNTPDSTKAFLAADINRLLEHLPEAGPGWLNAMRAAGMKTFGDIDARATKNHLPYLEVIAHGGLTKEIADTISKAISKVSESFSGLDDLQKPEPKAKKKGGKK